MKSRLFKRGLLKMAARRPRTILSWEFIRGHEHVNCQIVREVNDARGGFAVVVVPYQSMFRASVDVCEGAADAFRRHALLASGLRASGWRLASYTD